jgi:hypothetical protein
LSAPYFGSLARIVPPRPNPANPLCIVCDGRDPACWSSVRKLTGPAPLPEPPRCVYCGRKSDEPGNYLLQVVYAEDGGRGFIHARCWPLIDQEENNDAPNDDE